jgi:two-component system OmpR family response regulator
VNDSSFPSILCADDDPDVLELLKEHFTHEGFIVLTATNGVEACLQFKRWAPKAVILDLLIPRLGGLGTLGRIRAFDPSIPIIFVSDTTDALDLITKAGLSVAGAFAPLPWKDLGDTGPGGGQRTGRARRRRRRTAPPSDSRAHPAGRR